MEVEINIVGMYAVFILDSLSAVFGNPSHADDWVKLNYPELYEKGGFQVRRITRKVDLSKVNVELFKRGII